MKRRPWRRATGSSFEAIAGQVDYLQGEKSEESIDVD
jgi:hypothetical protein